jgi:hypothetical protein
MSWSVELTTIARIRRYTPALLRLILTSIEVQWRSTMATCPTTPTTSAPLGARLLATAWRFFSRSAVTREAIDQAWLESGLGRLDRDTLEDIGAPPQLLDRAEQRESWKLAAALDATRHL